MDCIFCKIVAGEIPCHTVHESEHTLAFLDIMPVSRGHVLVIPKQHVEFAYDADPAVMAEVMRAATQIAKAVKTVLACDGMNFILNCGARAGQVVPHAHLHIVPRYPDDGIHWPWPQGTLDADEAARVSNAIAETLR
jgi:histidine triad (HIT) family protein